jgi:hypothetical protein
MENIDVRTKLQNEIIAELPIPAHGVLLLAMRTGKSRIVIEQIKKEDPKSILWVTPQADLRDVAIPKEFKKWKADKYLNRCNIVCYGSLAKITGHYDKIILDELQYITEANAVPLLEGGITYDTIVGLTGTMPKHEEKHEIYNKLKLKILKEITVDDAVDLGLISDYTVTAISTTLDTTTKNITGGSKLKPFMTTEAGMYKYLHATVGKAWATQQNSWATAMIQKRMHFIYNLPSKLVAAKQILAELPGRTICFSGNKKQAEALSKNVYHSTSGDVKLKAFHKGKLDVLSMVNSGSVGHTFENVDNILIVQVNSNKSGTVSQKLARGLLLKEGHVANIYMLYCESTVDESWFNYAVEDMAKKKLTINTYKEYIK